MREREIYAEQCTRACVFVRVCVYVYTCVCVCVYPCLQVLYILHDEVWEFKWENITKSSTSRGYRKLQVKPHVHGKLQADKTPPPEPNNNYHFTIAVRGPDVAQAWGTLRERVLCYSKLSKSYLNTGVHDKAIALLPSEIPAGSVYVRGLYICEEPKLVALGIAVNCKVEVCVCDSLFSVHLLAGCRHSLARSCHSIA